MADAKHTPGPWDLDSGPCPTEQLEGHAYVNAERWFGLAQVAVEYGASDGGGPINEGWANAHLIAAAPDLYEALRELDRRWSGDGWITDQDAMHAIVRDALAKARKG